MNALLAGFFTAIVVSGALALVFLTTLALFSVVGMWIDRKESK